MVNLFSVGAGKSGGIESLADVPRLFGKAIRIAVREGNGRILDEIEPVSSPCDVAGDGADPRDSDGHVRAMAIRGHVLNGDAAIGAQRSAHRAYRSLNAVLATANATKVSQGGDDADRAVTTHPEITNVIEEDDTRCGGGIFRLAEERADEHVGAAGFVDDRGPERIVLRGEAAGAMRERMIAKVWSPRDHDPGGLARSMGIDDLDGG